MRGGDSSVWRRADVSIDYLNGMRYRFETRSAFTCPYSRLIGQVTSPAFNCPIRRFSPKVRWEITSYKLT
jgi:hypothetical protein